ncbi:MAG: phage terminase large subunit [Parvularculales bacterium]
MLDFPIIYLEGDDDEIFIYEDSMNPVQKAFHADRNKFRWLGGGVGGGKSVAALVEILKQSWSYRNNYGFILRETFPDLRLSALKDFFTVCPHGLIHEQNRQEHWIKIYNHIGYKFMKVDGGEHLKKKEQDAALSEMGGLSEIAFISFEGTQRGEEKFRSANIGWYLIEQAESCYPAVYDALNQRMRRKPSGRKGIFVSNPDGRDWLWQFFHPNSPDRRKNHAYFPVKLQDNPTLPDDYHETLKDTYTDEEYQKMVMGSHDVATGAVYPELSREIHVIKHFEPPSEWDRGIGLDHGLNNATAFVLGAKFPSPYEGVYIYREYEEKDRVVSQHANIILSLLSSAFRCFSIDQETGKQFAVDRNTVLNEYNALGIPFVACSRDIVAGVNRVKEYLAYDPVLTHPITGLMGAPRLLISERCPNLIRRLGEYKKEEQKTGRGRQDPPEKFQSYNMHLPDALRYLLLPFTFPLTSKSKIAGYEKPRLQSHWRAKKPELLDDEGNYSIGSMIQESHKIRRTEGPTTWLAA